MGNYVVTVCFNSGTRSQENVNFLSHFDNCIFSYCRVREASMSGLETLTRYVAENDPSLFTPEM